MIGASGLGLHDLLKLFFDRLTDSLFGVPVQDVAVFRGPFTFL